MLSAPFFSNQLYLFAFLIIYIVVNALFLGRFPVVHSDETWLAGLTLRMIQSGSVSVTESFFDLFPRYPHAIKLLFHGLQVPFFLIGGYSHVTARLISLLSAAGTLFIFYRMLSRRFSHGQAFLGMVLLGLNIQFIYASHFARQEIQLLLVLILAFSLGMGVSSDRGSRETRRVVLLQGICIAVAIGFHPNSFIIFLPTLFLVVYRTWREKQAFGLMGVFLIPVFLSAVLFITLSFAMDNRFVSHYLSFGSSVGISADPVDRITGFFRYYAKLFFSVSGTYFVPRQKILWIIYAGVTLVGAVLLLAKRKPKLLAESFLALAGLNAGYLLVGKYSQPSVIFVIPFLTIILVSVIAETKIFFRRMCYAALLILSAVVSMINIAPSLPSDYDRYLENIEPLLPESGAVLANLNTGFLFEEKEFYDFRNLAFLREHDMTFGEYIQKNNIELLVIPEELSFIYDKRPRWNIIYGNIVPWYREMLPFLENECDLVDEFVDPYYGMRISRYIGERPWKVRIYRLKESG